MGTVIAKTGFIPILALSLCLVDSPSKRPVVFKGAILREGSTATGTASFTHINLGINSSTGESAYATVGGGTHHTASGNSATVSGGYYNIAGGDWATIGGGSYHIAHGDWATVAGGSQNTASGRAATVGGGYSNMASGDQATVVGGANNRAQGSYSLAGGHRAVAASPGSFVWGDSTDSDVECIGKDQWLARCSGGVFFYTSSDLTSGSYVAAGGNSWNSISDRATKENFTPVDRQAILEKLAEMPIQQYKLKSQDGSIRHIGPAAEDMHAAFGYGESSMAINMEDADGVALAAIQGLYETLRQKDSEIAELRARLAAIENSLSTVSRWDPRP